MSPVKSPEQHSARDVGNTYKIVVDKDEADELPPGWTKEVKTRKTGSSTKVDRRYTDPVTGYIFRSLKDVHRYLKTGKLGRLAIKPKKNGSVDTDNKDERLHMEEREERRESKEQMSETLKRKRPLDKTGSEFSAKSKSELLHRASKRLAAPSPPLTEPKTRQATQLAGIKAETPSPLSPEPKTRQATRLAGVVVDALPPTPLPLEYKIRQATHLAEVAVNAPPSLPPAEPKTCQATRLAQVTVDASLSSPSPVEPKTRNATRKAGIEINSPPPSPPDTKTKRLATHQAGNKIDASVTPPPPAPKTHQAAQQSEIKIDSAPLSPRDSKTRQATPQVGTKIVPSPPSQPEPKTRQAKRLSGIRDNASPASLTQSKTRRATRQAGIKIDSPPPVLPDTRTGRQAARARLVNLATPKENDKKTEAEKITDKHDENADMDNTNHNQENHNPKEHNKEIEVGPATLPPPEDHAPPTSVIPPVDFEKRELPVVNPTVRNPIPQDGYGFGGKMVSDSSMNFSMNDLWTDPCIEFAVKTLTGAIPCEDLNKPENPSPSPLKVPLEDLWTDPCIEFAVKTLTGAIPVGEDDHLQHRPATSRNTRAPHDFYLPDVGMSFCQTDVLSKHFETGQNKQQQQQQQQQRSTFGNIGLQKSGNVVNGQYSRSRFFQ